MALILCKGSTYNDNIVKKKTLLSNGINRDRK